MIHRASRLIGWAAAATIIGCTQTRPLADTYPVNVPGPDAEIGPGAIGCYVITWDSATAYFPDTVALLPDTRVSGAASHVKGSYRVLLTRHAWVAFLEGFAVSWWKPGPGDSVYIGRTDGFNGTTLRGRLTPDGILGSAVSYSDLVSATPAPTFPFHAKRAACLGFRGPAT